MLRSGRPCSDGGGEEIQCTTCHLDVAPDHDLVHPLLGALLPAHRVLQVLALLAVRGRAHGARGVVNLRNTRQLRIELIALTVWLPNFCLKGKLQRLLVLGPPTVLHLHPPLPSPDNPQPQPDRPVELAFHNPERWLAHTLLC